MLGTVYGITVRSRNWAAGLGMVLKSVVGGELRWFTNMVGFPISLHSLMHMAKATGLPGLECSLAVHGS